MNSFSFTKAHEVTEAIEAVTTVSNARFIAGGTNLIDLMKENVMRPDHLIDINGLSLHTIEKAGDGGLRLGALVTNADTAYHPLVETEYPLLNRAILAGASPQLRNMATNGGNLMQRTRCYYFYDLAAPCNKREPGSGCTAIAGVNRIHAILGTSESCIAVHPSDLCVALATLNATVQVQGSEGERQIPFADFHRLPGTTPHLDNNLQPDELITAITIPPQGFKQHYAYLKIRDRASYAFALVSVAAAFELEAGGIIKEARLALGGVAHKPWRDMEVEEWLKGREATADSFAEAANRLLTGAVIYGDNDFKPALAKRAIIRACLQAIQGENTHAY